ncbi:MAG: SMP-30/gluconolactonase/LRE family protein, partial [Smithellaceae bacterium]|nr:SMP-30/gluconolactonase/LRE family protein [Smithellaceae bacterium]
MKKIFFTIALLLVILAGYFLFWPVPIEPVAWNAPAAAGYTGPHAVNTGLSRLNLIDLGAEEGPEHIVLGKDGRLYVSVGSGNILRMNPDGTSQEVFIRTGGRVLGFDFDAEGNLIAADAVQGLLSVSPQGKITLLTRSVNGDPIRYADAVVVARSGMIYLSDASRRFSPAEWGGPFEASILDIMEMSSTGRVLAYDPAQKSTRVVAGGFCFANGLALSRDEQNLFVSETGKYRLWKVSVHAQELDIARPGDQAKIVFDNLPGFPDNLMRGQDGKIWMGFAKPRN